MQIYSEVGVQIPRLLLPRPEIDPQKWSVIACDQFTSQPEYWQEVEHIVGNSPSTLNLILPEVFLGKPDEPDRIKKIRDTMQRYTRENILSPYEGLMVVERTAGNKTRHGVMLALDLERYDFNKGSQSLIRATEATVVDRLPPRIKIRKDAPLELPHILVLIDDPERTVIEPLLQQISSFKKMYDFDLMLGSGHLRGYFSDNQKTEKQVIDALAKLAEASTFYPKYNVGKDKGILLFAVGDGNHSLATAKSIWEQIKPQVGLEHPARYALVEIENIHDEGLAFEPIHRVIFDVNQNLKDTMIKYFGERVHFSDCSNSHEMVGKVSRQSGNDHIIGYASAEGYGIATITNPSSNLPVGTLQAFLDDWQRSGGYKHIDYVHGEDVVDQLGTKAGNLGFYLPAMNKSDLFKTVILDGALPRKTFSMGEAKEKRFYMECKDIA